MAKPRIMASAFLLPSTDNPLATVRAACLSDDSMLPFMVVVVVEAKDDPIFDATQLVGSGSVGIEGGKMPALLGGM